ncbi:MAG: L-threonylcarbamoyladenylate synthase [Elusimicrobiota bacterium]
MTRIIRLAPGETLAPEALAEVARAAAAGRIVVFPTDTVYGIGTTALSGSGSRRIYRIKNRDSRKPLPILVHSKEEARRWVEWTPWAEVLAERFWPGALTLALRPTPEGRRLMPGLPELPTLAVRMPAHPVTLSLLSTAGVPWASTSANRSGTPALTEGSEAVEAFSGAADYIVAAGSTGGAESSVVDASGSNVRVLREGALKREEVLKAASEAA